MAGHNKWSQIKHRKGAQDAKRGKLFTKVVKEITIAARDGGGDPDANARLRRALDLARVNNVPADNIQRAIKRGTGELEGVNYEELLYEGVGPAGTLFLVSAVTDNRNRTAPELRKIFDKQGGQLGTSGSALWAFDERGVIYLPREAASEEQLFEVAAESGADDIVDEGEQWCITTAREACDTVREALEQAGLAISSSGLAYLPKTPKQVGGDDVERLIALAEALDDHDDVQDVFTDFDGE